MLNSKQDSLRALLREAIRLLCVRSLEGDSEICVEGLLGITIDNKDIFLVNIKEIIGDPGNGIFKNTSHVSPELIDIVTNQFLDEPSKLDKTAPVRVFPVKSPLVRHRVPVVFRGRSRRRGLSQVSGVTREGAEVYKSVPGLPTGLGSQKRPAPDSSEDFSDRDSDSENAAKTIKKERLDTTKDKSEKSAREFSAMSDCPCSQSAIVKSDQRDEADFEEHCGDNEQNVSDQSNRTLIIKPDIEDTRVEINLNEISAINPVNPEHAEFGFEYDDSGEKFQPIAFSGPPVYMNHGLPPPPPYQLKSQHAQGHGVLEHKTSTALRRPHGSKHINHNEVPPLVQASAPTTNSTQNIALTTPAVPSLGQAKVMPEVSSLQPLLVDPVNPNRYKDALVQWPIVLESIIAAELRPAEGTTRASFLLSRLIGHIFSKEELASCTGQGLAHFIGQGNADVPKLSPNKVEALQDFLARVCYKESWTLLDMHTFEGVFVEEVMKAKQQLKGHADHADQVWKLL